MHDLEVVMGELLLELGKEHLSYDGKTKQG